MTKLTDLVGLSIPPCIIAVLILTVVQVVRNDLILTIKEHCQMDNYGKFGKNCSYKVMGFKLSKLCSGVGNLFRFLDPGARILH